MRKSIIAIAVCGLLIIITLCGIVWKATRPIICFDKSKYLEVSHFISEFVLFPETTEDIAGNITEYHYIDYQLSDGIEVYLSVSFREEEALLKEWNEIADIIYQCSSFSVNHAERFVEFDNAVLFSYPALIAMYNIDGIYEYAVLDITQRSIIYVYIENIQGKHSKIPRQYLPISTYDDSGYIQVDNAYMYNVYSSEYNKEKWYD